MTSAQKKWLKTLRDTGFVEAGGWGYGQRNRPLGALVEAGLAKYEYGPLDSPLKVFGFIPTGEFEATKNPMSETLTNVVNFLSYR